MLRLILFLGEVRWVFQFIMWDREEKQRVEELVEGRIDARQIPKCLEKTIANPLFIDLLFKLCKYMKCLDKIQKRCNTQHSWTSRTAGSSRYSFRPKAIECDHIKQLSREIGLSYGGFLMKQQKFRTIRQEGHYYECLFELMSEIVKQQIDGCDDLVIKKQINRLFKTNTFNTKLGYEQIKLSRLDMSMDSKPPAEKSIPPKSPLRLSIDYKHYRKGVLTQRSFIRPYVNNKSCYKSKQTRSPIISLIVPTKEFNLFNFQGKKARSQNYI